MLPRFGEQSPQEIKAYEFKRQARRCFRCFSNLVVDYIQLNNKLPENNKDFRIYSYNKSNNCLFSCNQNNLNIKRIILKSPLKKNDILENTPFIAVYPKLVNKDDVKLVFYVSDLSGKIIIEENYQIGMNR